MENNKYIIERLSFDNVHHLAKLHSAVYGKHIAISTIRKKYDTKNLGVEYLGYMAFTNAHCPVAFYGIIPCLMQVEQKDILVAQSADTMTHKEHRNQGLFILLAERTYRLAKENTIKFIFGFPNQNSLQGFIKLKWEFLPDKLQRFSLKAGQFPYVKLIIKSRLLAKFYNQILKQVLPKSNDITTFQTTANYGIKRNQEFFDYKKYNPTFFTKVDNVDLWIKIDGLLRVGLAKIPQTFDSISFKKKIKRMAILLGCSEVLFLTHKNSTLYHCLIPVIEPMDAFPVGFYNVSGDQFEFDKIQFEQCDIDTF